MKTKLPKKGKVSWRQRTEIRNRLRARKERQPAVRKAQEDKRFEGSMFEEIEADRTAKPSGKTVAVIGADGKFRRV